MTEDVVRQQYRELTTFEKAIIEEFKETTQELIDFLEELNIDGIGSGRELALARTKYEEAVMWAVKGITK